jgi:tetratricopeptide (TPR) repeat protein
MQNDIFDELFAMAEDHFVRNEYAEAEPVLNELVLKNARRPEVFHMLGTIYYDQGKFKKAIRAFKRALEIDPSFTDSGVGLSIILNDLGHYTEGQKVFEEARAMLDKRSQGHNDVLNERLASKHEELGDLYFQHRRYEDALREFQNALPLTKRSADIRLHIASCYIESGNLNAAIKELKNLLRDKPDHVAALLKLGKAFYDLQQVPEAVAQWEMVLRYEPNNRTAKDYLRLAQSVQVTAMFEPNNNL